MWLWSAKPAWAAAWASGRPFSIAPLTSARRRSVRYRSGLVPKARRKWRASVKRSAPVTCSSRGRGLLACVRRQVVARQLDGPEVDPDRAVAGPAAEPAERIGERGGDLSLSEVADRLVEVGEQGGDQAGGRRRLLDGLGDEWQRASVERPADELGRQVEDAVAEAVVGSGGAVVGLVGMQDVQLPGQADPPRAAVAERLHAGGGDADRVGVVPVRLERAGGEVHLEAFQAGRAGPQPDRVAPPAAGSFKTIGIDAA
jgi:hypothetical protein